MKPKKRSKGAKRLLKDRRAKREMMFADRRAMAHGGLEREAFRHAALVSSIVKKLEKENGR